LATSKRSDGSYFFFLGLDCDHHLDSPELTGEMKPTFGGGDQAPPMSAVAFRLR
jgi:hypothetical protein